MYNSLTGEREAVAEETCVNEKCAYPIGKIKERDARYCPRCNTEYGAGMSRDDECWSILGGLGYVLFLLMTGMFCSMTRYQSVVLDSGDIARVGMNNRGVTRVYCDNVFRYENPFGSGFRTYPVVDLDGDGLPDERERSFRGESTLVSPEEEAIFIEAVDKAKGGLR